MDNPEKLATQDEEKQHVFDTTFTRSSNAYDQIIYFYIGNNCNTILTWVMLFSLKKKHPERIAGQTVAVPFYPSSASEFSPELWGNYL
jgi:hypothetical protein